MGYRSLPDKFIKGFEDGYIYINKVLYKYKGQMPETFTVEEGTKGISCNLWDERFNYFDPPVKELNLRLFCIPENNNNAPGCKAEFIDSFQ